MTRFVFPVLAAACLAAPLAAFPPPREKPEDRSPDATKAHWDASSSNLKRIGLACHYYHDAHGHLPSNVLDAKGKPLLSWRVLLLPYLKEEKLSQQFKMDEAWDGPTNKPLLEKMPKVFAPVRVKGRLGMTFYQGFSGPDAIFDPKTSEVRLAQVADGTANTCLAVEAGTAVEWTKPADLPFDPKKELPKLGGLFDGEFNMLMCDGSVMAVRKDYHAETMKNVVMKNDGTVINPEMIRR
jgi:hypothetical protein